MRVSSPVFTGKHRPDEIRQACSRASQDTSKSLDVPTASGGAAPVLDLFASRHFPGWLQEQQVSLPFTTYHSGKLFLVGLQPNARLSVFERTLNRCLGLWGDGQSLWMSSLFQLWWFENTLPAGQVANGYDRVYVPWVGYVAGDLDIHDVAVTADGRLVFVNTLFGCLATLSDQHSFIPIWRPRFLSKLAAEDRCHLNGLALENGQPAYVTAVSQSDVADGWRKRRQDGGCAIDVRSKEVIVSGLSMPHSPRVHRGQLWLLNSGTGQFGRVDTNTGKFEPVCFCPGYLRGLSFVGDYAVVGLSQCRQNRTFQGLALDEELRRRDAETHCGICVIDLRSGDLVHWLWLRGVVQELYDVVVLPGVRRPSALGFNTDEICRTLSGARRVSVMFRDGALPTAC